MVILYQTARKSSRPARVFGLGLGRIQQDKLPVGPSAADREWAAFHLNADSHDFEVVGPSDDLIAEFNAEIDRRAEEAAWLLACEAHGAFLGHDATEF